MKKIIALILVLLLLFQVTFGESYDGGKVKIDPSNWTTYKAIHGLGPEVTLTSNGRTFNKEIFEEKGLVVYGDYSLISGNDFKVKSGGYYTKNGVAGEYRFHGYDLDGNKHSNIDFPKDADSGTAPEQKYWIYQPWRDSSFGNSLFKKYIGTKVSDYNSWAINGDQAIAKLINEGLPFKITETLEAPNGDKNPINYMNVNTMPTTFSSGQGTLIHKSVYDSRPWYHSFPIAKAVGKTMIPVEAKIPSITTIETASNGDVVLKVRVTGFLDDRAVWGDEQKMAGSYHRKELKSWEITLTDNITGKTVTLPGSKSSVVDGYADFEVKIPQSSYESRLLSDKSFKVNFIGTAKAIFGDSRSAQDFELAEKVVKGTEEIVIEPNDIYVPPRPEPIEFEVDAPTQILDRWAFNLNLSVINDSKAIDRYVELDGRQLSEAEETSFLSGNYRFPILGESKVYDYKIVYVHQNSDLYFYQGFVVVHDSVPYVSVRVTDPGKVNRKVSATFDTAITNIFVRQNSNVQIKSVTAVSKEGNQIYYGANNSSLIEFMQKQTGTVELTVVVGNEYGDRVVKHSIYAGEDHAPDIVAMIWNNYLSRADNLDITAEGASLDGDTVTSLKYDILYDENKDGVPEKSIKKGDFDATFNFKPSYLGSYKIVFTAVEAFGQPTLPAYITDADYKKTVVEREFFVENLIPMTKLYSDVEYTFPELNVALIIDQGVPRAENDYIKTQQVQIENQFRLNSMVADLDVWDTYTYIFSQTAYQRVNSGGSYPSSTYSYNSGGYSGTLNRYNVDNYPYTVDNGSWQTRTLSKTVTMTKDGWGESGSETRYYPDGGYVNITYYWATYSYSSDGWYGSASGSGNSWWQYDKNGKFVSSGGTNQPTVSGTAYKTETYWQSNYVNYNDYYGDYSGTVYKNVKQTYTPSYSTKSSKYIVYMASGVVNNKADLLYVKNIARDAKLIVIGPEAIRGTLGENHFITYSTNTQSLINQIVAICETENPIINEFAILVNTPINFSYTDIDEEGDPIVEHGFQFVHDPNYFDNPLGIENGTYAAYSDSQYSTAVKNSFSKPGKYEVYRRIKDAPIGYESQGAYSNLAKFDLVVHRAPIANATLDWDYDAALGVYKTTWVDKSYDPDFQYRDAERGIVDRKIKYKLNSSSSWTYEIPNNLSSGTYNLEYVVMDKHGVWSSPFTMTFTLNAEAPIQFSAELRAKIPEMQLNKFTIGNDLEWFDVWTRFPYAHRLEISLWDGATRVTALPIKTVTYTGTNATKNGNDYYWNNINYTLPKGIGLQEKTYTARIEAISNSNASNKITINRNITLINNTAPTVSFTAQFPTTVYEGDTIRNTILPIDGDGDRLTVQYYVAKPGQALTLFKTYTNVQQGVPFVLDDVINVDQGNYQFRVVVNDGNGGVGQADKTISVNPFEVTSYSLLPSDPMAGDMLYFNVATTGYVDKIEIIMESDIVSNDNRVSMGYSAVNYQGNSIVFPISPITLTSNKTYQYIAWVSTPQSVTLKGVRNRAPYTFTIRAWRGVRYKDYFITRDIKGDVRQTLKMGIDD